MLHSSKTKQNKTKTAKITEFETHTEVNAKGDLTYWRIKVPYGIGWQEHLRNTVLEV
jgi:hypothetical protein